MSLLYRKNPKDLRGKWSDVGRSLGLILLLYLSFRWIAWEPFVIPSGSMEETLLVQDYVLVKKWAYGLRIPFTEKWIIGPKAPERGDIVVFKSKEDGNHMLVKRVIGLPGDLVEIDQDGKLSINGLPFRYRPLAGEDSDYQVLEEQNGIKAYRVQYFRELEHPSSTIEVPEGELFMMGDNRNHSADSRFWGTLPMERIVGKLQMIWMSCEESEKHSSFLCPPESFRIERMFRVVH